MTRFEIAPEWVAELMWRVCAEYRPGLVENDAQILVLFDLKPRKSQGGSCSAAWPRPRTS